MIGKNFGVDLAEREPDYTSLEIIDLRDRTIDSMIIRTDNPDPNSWVKKFWRNEQETKEQEPSDENGREHDLRNAEDLNDTPMDDWMNKSRNWLQELKKELVELKGEST